MAAAPEHQVITVDRGQNTDVYFEINVSGKVFLSIHAPPGGEPARTSGLARAVNGRSIRTWKFGDPELALVSSAVGITGSKRPAVGEGTQGVR